MESPFQIVWPLVVFPAGAFRRFSRDEKYPVFCRNKLNFSILYSNITAVKAHFKLYLEDIVFSWAGSSCEKMAPFIEIKRHELLLQLFSFFRKWWNGLKRTGVIEGAPG